MPKDIIEERDTTPQLDEQIEEYDDDDLKEIAKTGGAEYGYPLPPTKESIFKFFRRIIDTKDSSKIGNLDHSELGDLNLAVRKYQELGLYAKQEKMNVVSDYLYAKGEIILATSLSKKGFLPQLFVTQIKKDQKIAQAEPNKKNWWKKKQVEGGAEQ